jgi:homocysteine S-methyltransferase
VVLSRAGLDDLLRERVLVLDGGLSTQLQRRGQDISGPLWTAQALLDDPDAVAGAHADFAAAGADVVITASYQVSRQGFAALGRPAEDADAALAASVRVARAGAPAALVAASVGPYGAVLHDGSEYRGDYGLSHRRLVDFHAERLDALLGAEPDLLAVETIPDVREIEALVDVLADAPDVPAWVTVTARDDERLWAGQSIEEAVAAVAAAPSVAAVGVNCTDPRFVPGLVARIVAVTDLPVVAYPNAGGTWDARTGEWRAASGLGDMSGLLRGGVRIVGGCCGTDAEAISALAGQVARTAP